MSRRIRFAALVSVFAAAAPSPAPAQTAPCVILDESFSGTSLASGFEAYPNSGTVTVAGGLLALRKNGITFPYVRTVPGSLAAVGVPWTIEVRMRWTGESYCGNGMHAGPEAVENLSVPCTRGVLEPLLWAWRDSTVAAGGQVRAGTHVVGLGLEGNGFHTFRWDGDGCSIAFSLDGRFLFSAAQPSGGGLPLNLWFGNPCNSGCGSRNWADLEIDWVRVTSECAPSAGEAFFDGFAYVFSNEGCAPPAAGAPHVRCGSTPGGRWHKVSEDLGHAFAAPALVRTSQEIGEPGLDDLILDVPGTPPGEKPAGAQVESAAIYGTGSYRARVRAPLPTGSAAGTAAVFALRGRDEIEIAIATANAGAGGCGSQTVCCSLRNLDACGSVRRERTLSVPVPYLPGQEYRVIGFDWLDDRIDFHLDGVTVETIAAGEPGSLGQPMEIPSAPLRIVLEHGTGSALSGTPPAVAQRMRVDWVSYAPTMLTADADTVPVAAGGTITYALAGGTALAGQSWVMLGSVAGSAPGLTLLPNGPHVPLNFAPPLTELFVPPAGVLDAAGAASTAVVLPAGLPAALVGLDLYAGFAALGTGLSASNPWRVRFVP